MASLADNVAKVVAANAAIKDALAAKGVDVTDYTKLSQAAEKIAAIETGGGGLDAETIAAAVSAMDGTTHDATTETAASLATSIKEITRKPNRRVLTTEDGTEVTENDIAAMTWDITEGVSAFAVAVSDTFPDGTARPHGLQFTIGWRQLLSGHTSYSVDWGDGTKTEGITEDNPTHTYAKAGVYKIELSDDLNAFQMTRVVFDGNHGNTYNWNISAHCPQGDWSQVVEDDHTMGYWSVDNLMKVVRVLQWGASVTSALRTYQNCDSLVGTIPPWGESIITARYCYGWCAGLTGSVPAWTDKIGNGDGTYFNCSGLTGTIPEWGAAFVNLYSTYEYCTGLTGTIPPWTDKMQTLSGVYSGCTGLTGSVPDWGAAINNASGTYSGCSGLTGTIPDWGAAIYNAQSTYSGCSGLTGTIPDWGAAINNASGTYANCSGLTGAIPAWGAAINNAYQTYCQCSGLTGSVPAWGRKITNAYQCYYYCVGLTTVWDTSAADTELMPSAITNKGYCFTGCDNRLREYFLTAWGGTRAS